MITERSVDVVLCVDATKENFVLSDLKENAASFYPRIAKAFEDSEKTLAQLRIKVIAFRDYGCDDEAMLESPFYVLPEQNEAFIGFLAGIEAKGESGAGNALEAIALALKSDWTTGAFPRHYILVSSNSATLPLGARADSAAYPAGMPKDLAELGAWWEDGNPSFCGSYQPRAGRLIAFVPNASPWIEMQAWNRYWYVISYPGPSCFGYDPVWQAIDILVGCC